MAETFLYLTTTGRKTGNPHNIEIWYVEHEECYYLCAEHRAKSDWVQNIIVNDSVSFYIAEREQDVPVREGKAMIVGDEALLNLLRQKFDAKYNWSKGLFVGICEHEITNP